jgi:hypothetical protein
MSSETKRAIIAWWHFHCPECGVGDGEAGYHVAAETLWCEICLEEGRYVRLRRWPVDESYQPTAPLRRDASLNSPLTPSQESFAAEDPRDEPDDDEKN